MRDMVVVLPGILGSVLQKDGKDVWALSGQAVSAFLRSLGGSLKNLRVQGVDDPDLEDLDGVVATRLVPDAHVVPGLWKVDGYSAFTRFLKSNFAVREGENFFEFPYDWRRDNRAAAKRLKKMVCKNLKQWRESSGYSEAKTIFVAHSMGGLVCRHYLEVLEGWKDCRALITLGTPYRGSLKALNFLVNGHRVAGVDLSDLLRSCESVYQLLPTYRSVKAGTDTIKPEGLPRMDGFDPVRAAEAAKFHDEINGKVDGHKKLDAYRKLTVWPVIGVDQPTLQSAEWTDGKLSVSSDVLPSGVDPLLFHGDGTVPRASAVPLEMSDVFTMPFHAEMHGSLQNNKRILVSLKEWLRQSQVEGMADLKAVEPVEDIAELRPSIRLRVDDLYTEGEPIPLGAGVNAIGIPTGVKAIIYEVQERQAPVEVELSRQQNGDWRGEAVGLKEGCYRVRVRCLGEDMELPPPVTDVFNVAASGQE